jgi:hypothetical protein
MEKFNTYTTRFTIINGAKEILSNPITSTPSECVVNTSVECITTSSRLINGTKFIISKLFSMFVVVISSILSFFWTRVDNLIKTHILPAEKKKKKKTNKKNRQINEND